MRIRRKVTNHIGTVHAIAMCNLAEIGAGTMTDATVPSHMRWIPRGMTVEYLAKARTDLVADVKIDPLPSFQDAADIPVEVAVSDMNDQVVFRAIITMWVTPKS